MRRKLGQILIFIYSWIPNLEANEGLLLDTRLATSDLGWKVGPNSGWDEISGHDDQGNEYRMFQICEIQRNDQQNWLRTNYIKTFGANRVFVEIEFTIRSCEDLQNVKVCKETFNLHYYEADSDKDVPAWNTIDYKKVDTVAADRRFSPDAESKYKSNFETREIGPLSKNGLFIAIQDTGACMALMHLKVYYKFCPMEKQNLAIFPRTISGPDEVSLEEAQGACVPNAVQAKDSPPKLYCNAKGNWSVNSGKCVCSAGYQPSKDLITCNPCTKNTFKSSEGNAQCRQCPRFSTAPYSAAHECSCDPGFYRAQGEGADEPCSTTPSAPRDLTSEVNESRVNLSWMAPASRGDRDDLFYEVQCESCSSQSGTDCKKCPSNVIITPNWRVSTNNVQVSNLDPAQFYRLKVVSKNGVSKISSSDPEYAEIMARTAFKPPTGIANVNLKDISSNSVLMSWDAPPRPNGQILDYETILSAQQDSFELTNVTTSRNIRITGLQADSTYTFKVRARTRAGFGPFSNAIEIQTTKSSENGIFLTGENVESALPRETETDKTAQIAGAAAGGAVIVIMIIVFLVICTKRNSYRKGRKFATELGVTDVTFHPIHPMGTHAGQTGGKMYVEPWMTDSTMAPVNHDQPELDLNQIDVGNTLRRNVTGAFDIHRGTFRPFNANPPRDVLIKRLRQGFSHQQKKDFENDRHVMSRLFHENILRFEGAIFNSRPMMIVCEFLEHPSADEFLRTHRREFSSNQLIGMMRQVCSGMKYLVEQGFVHRDLAAKNISCNSQLLCKIADFSMCQKLAETQFVLPGVKCSYKWSAPEAISQRRYSEASDVWSFGVLSWEIINYGESPYWEMNDEEVIRKIESGYRLPATQGSPVAVHQLMLDCWKSQPNERPPFHILMKRIDQLLRNPSANVSHRSSQYSGSCMTLDSDASTTSSLGQWLEGIGLGHYRERLQQNGFNTLEELVQMSRRDMNDLGIVSVGDQNHLQEQARALHSTKTRQNLSYTQRCEMSLERGTTVAV